MRLQATTIGEAATEILVQCYAEPQSGCLLWGGPALPYAQPPEKRHGFVVYNDKLTATARIVWEATAGRSAADAKVGHTCKNSRCNNPDHLYLKGRMPYWGKAAAADPSSYDVTSTS